MFICYLLNMPKMETLVTDINDFSFFKKPKDFVKINKRIEWLVAIYNFCIYGVITLYSILSYTEKSECLEENEKFEKDKICGLLANTWMAIDLTRSPINEIFICLQTYSGWVFMVGGINMFSFVFACIENLILRLNVIKAIMQEMFESDSESEKRRLLNYCIRYHVNVIEFIHRLNAAFRSVTFASISLFSLLMALAAYQFINVPSVKALLHFQGFFLTWFIICFMGQRIITQSLEFNAFLYNTPWYTQSVSIQKDFLMVLRRSQFPLEIWAGPFATMSFPTFQLVMRNTYTFVTVLSMALE
ncbi:PREDICTED: odorant receptor 4-like [Nicrophorus vespilloides]|uniref:Odorant receptor 4-like n=1 Tax=Nicrophorus vespilloides TaxID=110193 RepID=A0ABM1MTC9_NICVS|nr:PREDICTED: odorant receptor 4-like [Nicrophorus vespilloides]